jgi:hypothetical protein
MKALTRYVNKYVRGKDISNKQSQTVTWSRCKAEGDFERVDLLWEVRSGLSCRLFAILTHCDIEMS